jgi:signal transduction histidine kinase
VTAANTALAKLLGVDLDDLNGVSLSHLLTTTSRTHVISRLSQLESDSDSLIACQLLHFSDQQPIDCELNVAKTDTEHNGTVVHIRDLRESKKLQQLQNEFISTTSHELRTPLTVIIGSLSLLDNEALGPLEPPVKELVSVAHQNSKTLQGLITDLLDMDKLLSGNVSMELAEHNVLALVKQSVDILKPYAEKFLVKVVVSAQEGDATINVDQLRFQQIINNLLSNAIKFSGTNTQVTIDISTQASAVKVSITDQGPGVSAAFLPRLFTRFSQADASDTRKVGGTGLGLAISKALVEQMHGHIGYSPAHTSGSTFWFELPRVATNEF